MNGHNELFRWSADRFQQIWGGAIDISIGADGSVFAIGASQCDDSGCDVYRIQDSQWQLYPGRAIRIAVDPTGNPWIVNRRNQMFRWVTDRFVQVSGEGTDIGVGADEVVYIVGTAPCDSSGCMIFRGDGSSWTAIGAMGVNISSAGKGNTWFTNGNKAIYKVTQ